METICGIDCSTCVKKDNCKGCLATNGHTLGGNCVRAECCHARRKNKCSECCNGTCDRKVQIIKEINDLKIKDMPVIMEMNELGGFVINLEFPLPTKQTVKFWKDENIYWGMRLRKQGSNRYYGIAADEENLLISEFGEDGSNPEIILYKKR